MGTSGGGRASGRARRARVRVSGRTRDLSRTSRGKDARAVGVARRGARLGGPGRATDARG